MDYSIPFATAKTIADTFTIAHGNGISVRQEYPIDYPRDKDVPAMKRMVVLNILADRTGQHVSFSITESSDRTVEVCNIENVQNIYLLNDTSRLVVLNDVYNLNIAVKPN